MLAGTGDGGLCVVQNEEPVDAYRGDTADMTGALATAGQLSVGHLTRMAPAPSDVLRSCGGVQLGPPCQTPHQM